ncbi:hypothetical protein [Bradyrhizobium sp. STM 3809]|uniref:hypothetical protein n=1 Tax=Bradyrhizobium sp. STM 3809 TaxID=551936 RepID=UPI0002409E9B|nr:hypothetical protein [Bradyrhizobium sp. STM 3809]CCE03272.1 hypothetical protein BRAS3809_7150002 [Bradyrhizobium sp. STM 3809]
MGISVAIILHGLLYAVLVAVLSLAAWLLRLVLRPGPRWSSALRVTPFVIAAIPYVGFVATLLWANYAPPTFIYSSVFGQSAGSDVSALRGQSDASNDFRNVFMSFSTSDDALKRTLETLRLERAETLKAADLVPLPGNIMLPDWWTAQRCADRTVFIAKNVHRWDDIVVTQCRSDATVYVQASWID